MPRAKDTSPADTVVEPENGFAALETKVEEIQVEAAIEAELATEDAAAAVSPTPLEEISQAAAAAPIVAAPPAGGPAADPAGAVTAMLRAFEACAQDTLRFHAETIASFAHVRGPQDLMAAQVDYGTRSLGLYMGALTRVAQALPAFARPLATG